MTGTSEREIERGEFMQPHMKRVRRTCCYYGMMPVRRSSSQSSRLPWLSRLPYHIHLCIMMLCYCCCCNWWPAPFSFSVSFIPFPLPSPRFAWHTHLPWGFSFWKKFMSLRRERFMCLEYSYSSKERKWFPSWKRHRLSCSFMFTWQNEMDSLFPSCHQEEKLYWLEKWWLGFHLLKVSSHLQFPVMRLFSLLKKICRSLNATSIPLFYLRFVSLSQICSFFIWFYYMLCEFLNPFFLSFQTR